MRLRAKQWRPFLVSAIGAIVFPIFAKLVLSPPVFAADISFGLTGGGYANSDFNARYEPGPNGFPLVLVLPDAAGYVVGPSVEARLLERLSLGVEALYKPLHYRDAPAFQDGVITGYSANTVITWQFPILGRYSLPLGGIRPFVEGGPSLRAVGNLNLADPSHLGFSAGAGVELPWRRVRFTPKIRYTRWRRDPAGATVRTRPDQVEFLAGISYVPRAAAYPLGRRLSMGAVVGATVSPDVPTSRFTSSNPGGPTLVFETASGRRTVVAGPKVELSLTPKFSVELNALPRSFRHVTRLVGVQGEAPIPEPVEGTSGGLWEFPVLLNYVILSRPAVRPFVQVGPSFRLPKEVAGASLSNYGATVGLGVEIRFQRLKFAPGVRFTHWGSDRPSARFDRPSTAGSTASSGIYRNQVQIVGGVSF